jgi:hypothetical protein
MAPARGRRSLPRRPTVLLVTHLHTALRAVDTTIRLASGRIVERRGLGREVGAPAAPPRPRSIDQA